MVLILAEQPQETFNLTAMMHCKYILVVFYKMCLELVVPIPEILGRAGVFLQQIKTFKSRMEFVMAVL